MLKINRKADFRVTEDNIMMDSFYASNNSLFYIHECYVDNKIHKENKRYCFVQIKNRDSNEYKGSFSSMFDTKVELVECLNQFSCKPIDIEMNEI